MSDKQSKALANLQEQLRKQAEQQAQAAEATGSNRIKATPAGFEFPEIGTVPAPFDVVILGFVSRKTYYDKPYNPNELRSPACAAVGAVPFDELVPQDDAPDKQAESCKGCPMNEFGTSATGKGKKCTDHKVIAFMLPDAKEDDPIYTASISPSGLKDFNAYISRLNKRYQLPTVAFVTTLNIKPAGASVTISVKEKEPIQDEKYLSMFLGKQQEAMDILLQPIQFEVAEETA